MEQELISMTKEETSKYVVIKNLIDNKINGIDASKQICVSVRQIRRIKAKNILLHSQGYILGIINII